MNPAHPPVDSPVNATLPPPPHTSPSLPPPPPHPHPHTMLHTQPPQTPPPSTPPHAYFTPPQPLYHSPPPYQFNFPYPNPQYVHPQHVYPLPAWHSSSFHPFYPWNHPPPETDAPHRHPDPRPRYHHISPRPRRSPDPKPPRYSQDSPFEDDDSETAPPPSRRSARRRTASDRPRDAPHSAPHKHTPRPTSADATDRDNEAASLELEKSAKNAVSSADDVTLAFLLTSWANSLSEAHHHAAAATHFETVFHGSRALEIVAGDVLLTDLSEASTVRKALVSLLDRALYGNISFHDHFTSAVVALNQPLNAKDPDLKERCLRERQIALRSVLTFLRDIAINMTAYLDVLPFSSPPADNLKPRSPIAPSTLPSVRPAGPDPTKAVERSMDIWRRSVAGLQAKMALILVLENALASVDTHFPTAPSDAYFPELNAFCASMRETIRKFISADIATRLDKLSTHYWPGVTRGAHSTVFEAARSRAQLWITQFESSRQQVEAQLDDAGIGFGPSARVSEDKFSVLVSTSAAVAGLVSCHQHAFSWAKHAAKLLNCMVSAFQCLEKAGKGHLGPTEALRTDFYFGLDATFGAIDEVVDWSFSALHDKVLGSLEKSSTDSLHVGNTQPKIRLLRFEEPPRTPSKERELSDNGNAAVGASRRKPRHARMKSSPDALLHLNAHFDDYSDEEVDQGRAVDREIDYNEDRGSEQNSGADNVTKCEANPSQNGGVDGTCGKGSCQKRGDDELPVVYEGQPLEYGGDDEDDDDRDIIVHEDVEDSAKPKKMGHTSHIRSMSVDGIPF